MNLRSEIQRLAHQFDEEDNAAGDLWSWLPSHAAAEKAHGDYASNHRPSIASVMREAAMVIAESRGYPPSDADRAEWFRCPCGEEHESEDAK